LNRGRHNRKRSPASARNSSRPATIAVRLHASERSNAAQGWPPVRSQNLIHERNLAVEAFLASLEFMAGCIAQWISALRARFRRRGELILELIILRHQLAVLQRTGTRRPNFRPADRLFWVLLSRWWVDWRRDLMIVQPATVLRWRRQGLRSIWTSGSRGHWRGGRPRIDRDIRDFIVWMGRENFLWGAPRIHGELLKLGIDVSQATVSRYMPRRNDRPSPSWRTFLRNQAVGVGRGGFGETGQLPDQLPSLASGWIERIVWYASKVRDNLLCATTAPLGILQPRSSRSVDHNRRIRSYPRSASSRRAHWMMTDRRLLPYRSRASPRPGLRSIPTSTQSSSRPSRLRWRNRLTAASARVVGPRLLLHTRRQACHARRRSPKKDTLRRPAPCSPNCVDQVLRTHSGASCQPQASVS
jgi:hypothetical protein